MGGQFNRVSEATAGRGRFSGIGGLRRRGEGVFQGKVDWGLEAMLFPLCRVSLCVRVRGGGGWGGRCGRASA